MSLTNQIKNQHLLWRAGFGPAVEQLNDLPDYSPKQFYKALVKASDKKPDMIDVADDALKGLVMGFQDAGRLQKKELGAEERKQLQQKNRDGIRSLNLYWIQNMVNSKAQLREKLSLFWHGHFACRNLNLFYQQGLLDVLRVNALGNFGTMLKQVSKTAAMLNFLNNQQNKKDHPNENFAREVMELFTLGRGNYTEQDVKEAARAFTGWGATVSGEFQFRRFQHDYGPKTVLGKTGNFDGDEVLDILLQQKQTAKFIVTKMYRFFVNEIVDKEKAEWLADRFYTNKYEIGPLLEDIFASDWFYEEKNIGTHIKSPIELIVGMQRLLPMKIENEEAFLLLQRVLGQVLFYPPNVAGWPGGRNWIDSSSLMMRMRLPMLLNQTDEMNIRPKDDDDQMMGKKDADVAANMKKTFEKGGRPINVTIDWGLYVKHFEKISRENLVDTIIRNLLQVSIRIPKELISQYADGSGREVFIRTATLQVMSAPEYQLC
ncbi:MAG: DUF1800 domain-containing protein [Chitinophagaceae bacterium]|nr:DUF1800 domain-containing protein [Chitinophagaceae bacterium]